MRNTEPYDLDFCAWSSSGSLPRLCREKNPAWNEIEINILRIFGRGGVVTLDVDAPADALVHSLEMRAQPGSCRIVALTRDERPGNAILEWWEKDDAPFRGKILMDHHMRDARSICTDVDVALNLFKMLWESETHARRIMLEMRSAWDPMP